MRIRDRRLVWGALGLVLVGAAAYAYSQYGSIPVHDLVNPAYWVRRWRGEDLYDAQRHILTQGNRSLREVALTIDDGPHDPTAGGILDVLQQYHVHATFFVVGRRMKERPSIIRRMLADGHEVGNHSENHYRLDSVRPDQARREINDCDINFCRISQRHMRLLRPPGVRFNDTVVQVARRLGYEIVSWGVAAKDFEEVTPDFIVNRVLRRAENGSIILLHDDYPTTVMALPRILAALQRQGYRFVTVSEMLAHLPKPVVIQADPAAGRA
jgi:peptidoglycan-N-acetylglucosamine deacetylase